MKKELNYTNQNSSIQQLGYQFEFDIQIISIKIDYKAQFNFKVLIKRGNKQNEIDRIFKYNPYLDNEIPINEEFSIVSVLNPMENSNFNFNKNRVFHDKIYKIYICINTKTGFKPAISGELNLSNFIDDENENMLTLSNKTFNEVVIKFKINSKYKSEYDPLRGDNRLENDIQGIEQSNKLGTNSNSEDYDKTKYEELLEKKYINTLHINRSNNIFSNILKQDNNMVENNINVTEEINKCKIGISANEINEDIINNQIVNSNLLVTGSKFEVNYRYTGSSNIDEGKEAF